jgi:ABC-type proline/glycine betaine transport system ATPase subunit
MTTHQYIEALRLSDQMEFMKDRQIMQIGQSKDAMNQPVLNIFIRA